ncbi:probable carboxylesterase 6, partial [Primulina eburnea]|uniref:probable carboxylesterase 6 n=1 Tax=Primulina eburnea TaxID=1245227 RepID=UPI003C6C5200
CGYPEILANLASKNGCVIMSVNYRLAPENPLPAAYEDGVKTVIWSRQESLLAKTRQTDIKGLIRIQLFFGGESRAHSENYMMQPPCSALTLAASDTYWRLSLPSGENRGLTWYNLKRIFYS